MELAWSPVAGATAYQVQVSDTGLWGAGTYTATTGVPRFAAPVTLPHGDLVWRVRALEGDERGAWSAATEFTRGWDAMPQDPQTHLDANGVLPAVSWAPVPGASFYEVEYSRVPFDALDEADAPQEGTLDHFTCYTSHTWLAPYGVSIGQALEDPPGGEEACAFVVNSGEEADPDAGPSSPFEMGGSFVWDTQYFWRVRARDGAVDDRASIADGSAACTGVWVESGAVVESDGKVTVPVGMDPPEYAPTPDCSRWVDGGSFTPTVPDGWRDEPTVPTGLRVEPAAEPTSSPASASDTPLFRWDPVPGALKYRVSLGRSADLRDPVHVWETHATGMLPLGALPDKDLRTYWTVQACNGNARCSPPAPVRSFTKRATSTTTVVRGAVDDRYRLGTLRWSVQGGAPAAAGQLVGPAPQAKGYEVQVLRAGEVAAAERAERPPVVALSARTDGVGDAARELRWTFDSSELAQGQYEWRVRALPEVGEPLAWSAPGPLDVGAPVLTLAARSGFEPGAPVAVTASEAVTGVDGTSVQVVVAASGEPVRGTLRPTAAGRAWTFTPDGGWVAGQAYALRVGTAVVDLAGKRASAAAGTVTAGLQVDSASGALQLGSAGGAWTTVPASDAVGKSFLRTSAKAPLGTPSYAQARFRGTGVDVLACRGPRAGVLRVLLDGRTAATVDLYQSYSSCGRVWRSPAMTDGPHAVRLQPTGTRNARSTGRLLDVDAVVAR
ncbi:hypothetical protein D5H78_05700 [Vallicoccus soli]|uniref:SbsA Ig-like domain-containing protein n=1 Tax=Vallicoccus soli TaxID=2339232 RepID=A0A3A3ZKZ2_9ACTN|nr:hypothetical protein D5H78_05700 [Vallicoccus soli]